ncbi:SRPBCC family protein [Pseudooceanicola sp.]|uniref:SRPBCC family protein n=1 Tax=Pseudooceanicola sp. TaxID=1914328 RepID=UPI00260BE7B6|nr:SRPBCC family protein [Pseudooceanicola sp.]MDF1854030.1 SRPBCC family protein [Pseudooceanicola sp.]
MTSDTPITYPFQRSHSIVIATAPTAVFDYVTNPKTWPKWLSSSHEIDCDDRPMRFGDTFHEHWSTRTAPVDLDWLVIACEPPHLWMGIAQTDFMGPIVLHYTFDDVPGGTRFTRMMRNPARPKLPTDDLLARIDAESNEGLANIKRLLEAP